MDTKKMIKNSFYINIAVGVLVIFSLMQSCGASRKAGRVEQTNIELVERVDSLTSVISDIRENTPTRDEIDEMLDANMLDFLIYEDDVDKGRITLGQLKLQIREQNNTQE